MHVFYATKMTLRAQNFLGGRGWPIRDRASGNLKRIKRIISPEEKKELTTMV